LLALASCHCRSVASCSAGHEIPCSYILHCPTVLLYPESLCLLFVVLVSYSLQRQ
jgi:hypothetical protein